MASHTAGAIAIEIATRVDNAMVDIENAVMRIVVASVRFLTITIENPKWGVVLVDSFYLIPTLRTAGVRYLLSDIERGVQQGHFAVTLDEFLLDQIGALTVASLRRQLATGLDAQLLDRTCEHVLRLLGLTPAKAQLAIGKAKPLLDIPLPDNMTNVGGIDQPRSKVRYLKEKGRRHDE